MLTWGYSLGICDFSIYYFLPIQNIGTTQTHFNLPIPYQHKSTYVHVYSTQHLRQKHTCYYLVVNFGDGQYQPFSGPHIKNFGLRPTLFEISGSALATHYFCHGFSQLPIFFIYNHVNTRGGGGGPCSKLPCTM